MNRLVLASLVPPFAVCRYGCAGCCAAPIGVMWMAGIISIVYGFAGGPVQMSSISWTTLLLGCLLWLIASVWALTVIRGVRDAKDPKCSKKPNPICRIGAGDDDDPMSELKDSTQQ